MIDLVVLIQHIVINNPDRNVQYSLLQGVLGVSRNTAKQIMFAWIYRATPEKLWKFVKEDSIKAGV